MRVNYVGDMYVTLQSNIESWVDSNKSSCYEKWAPTRSLLSPKQTIELQTMQVTELSHNTYGMCVLTISLDIKTFRKWMSKWSLSKNYLKRHFYLYLIGTIDVLCS